MTESHRGHHEGHGRNDDGGHVGRRPGGLVAVVGAVLALLMVACGSDSPEGTADGGLEGLFSQIPDEPETRGFVQFSLPARAAEQMGIAMPAADADYDEIFDYVAALDGLSYSELREGEVPGPAWTVCDEFRDSLDEDAVRPELGFSPTQVHGVITAGSPPEIYCAMTGDFDPEGIEEVVRAEPAFSGLLEVAEFEGVDYYRWGEDFAGVTSGPPYVQTPVRRVGRGGRMYADEGRIHWGWADAMVENMVATGVTGSRESLADDEGIGSIVEHFDDRGVYGGFLSDGVGVGAEAVCGLNCDEQQLAAVSSWFTFADGIERWAAGWGLTPEGEHLVLLAVVSGDADDTEANLASIEANIGAGQSSITGQPWSEVFEVVDTVAEGRLGVVQLTYGTDSDPTHQLGSRLLQMLFRREALFANGG